MHNWEVPLLQNFKISTFDSWVVDSTLWGIYCFYCPLFHSDQLGHFQAEGLSSLISLMIFILLNTGVNNLMSSS